MSEEWLVALAPHRLLQARRALVYGMVDAGHCSCGFGWPAAAAATLQLRPAFGTAAQLHAGKSEEGRACAEHDHGAKGGGWAHGTFPPARGRSGACQGRRAPFRRRRGQYSGRHAQTYDTRVQSKIHSLANLAAARATCQPAAAAAHRPAAARTPRRMPGYDYLWVFFVAKVVYLE
jgi:hypothetical protein